jgi:hypothetical protein
MVHFDPNTVFTIHHIRLDGGYVYEESDPVDLIYESSYTLRRNKSLRLQQDIFFSNV